MLGRSETRHNSPDSLHGGWSASRVFPGFAAACALLLAACSSDKRDLPPVQTARASESLIWPGFTAVTAPAPSDYMRFGDFVDVDGDLAIIGAPTGGKITGQPGTAASRPGQVFVFARQHNTAPAPDSWKFEAKLSPNDASDWSEFGESVAIDGNFAVVGADGDVGVDPGSPDYFVGAAYVFERKSPGNWEQVQKLRPPNPKLVGQRLNPVDNTYFGIRYGRTVGISGDRLVVCAAKTDIMDATGTTVITNDAGSVWIYERQPNGTWAQAAFLVANPAFAGDQLGINCRISGDYVVAGAFQRDYCVPPCTTPRTYLQDAGAVVVFERTASDGGPPVWQQKQIVTVDVPKASDNFGVTVSIDGTTFVAGSKGSDVAAPEAGAAYVFDRQVNGTWTQTARLLASDAKANDSFGVNTAISGEHIIVGAPGVSSPETIGDAGLPLIVGEGAAYFFTKQGASWVEERKVYPSEPVAGAGFGLQVNVDATTAIVAAPFYPPNNQGRAYLYEGTEPLASAEPCAEDQRCAAGSDGRGHCEDGICCDTVCGTCQACVKSKTGKPNGTCAPIPSGQDPDNECVNPACAGGVQTGNECSGAGACNTKKIDCDPFACAPQGGLCNATCTVDTDCAKDGFCDKVARECFGKRTNGTICATDNQCASRNCVDGVCCNSSCAGQCEACDVADHAGTCTAIADAPHGKRNPCVDNQDACAGVCDGNNRATCTYAGSATSCLPSTCASSTEQPFECDGSGACVPGAPVACGRFACGDAKCRTDCAVDQDCATGFICQDSDCIPTPEGRCSKDGTRVLDATGNFVKDCTPYHCLNGQCGSSCAASSDCQTGFVCDRGKKTCQKVAKPPVSEEVGCVCHISGKPAMPGGALAMAAAVLAGVLGRRSGRERRERRG